MRLLVPALVLVLASCGGDENSQTADLANGVSPDPAAPSQAGAQGTADAEGVNCNGLAAPSGPDVVGVSIGMSAEDAYRAIACSNRALRVAFSDRGGFDLPPLADGRRPRTTITAESDQERITATLIGLPGQERVVLIRRSLNFPQGQEPVVTSLVSELQRKYGALEHNPNQYGAWSGRSLRDANNQPLVSEGPNGSLVASSCAMSVLQDNLLSQCGQSVAVEISFSQANQQLASRLVVAVNGGAFGIQQIAAYRAQARGEAEQRQAREIENAQGRAPNL